MTRLPGDDALYQHAACGLLLTDAAGLILRVNATLCRWLGCSATALIGKVRILDRFPVGARLFHQTHCLPLLQVQGSVAQMQVDIRDSAGQRVPVLVNIVRRTVDGEVFDEWAMFAVNERRSYERELVAARKSAEHALEARLEAETQLRSLNDALSDADRRKDEFLATLSHELRNPLAPMRSALEILKLEHAAGGSPEKRPLLDVFDRQLHHLTHLVDDLMEVSRITQGRMELRCEQVVLADIVQDAADDVAAMVREAGHTFSVAIAAPHAVVDADPTRLFQVVVNLLTNACKYTPNGGAISLTLSAEGQEAVIAVRDSGIGIPAHALGSVFDMFSQLKPALDRSKGGLGIGLALVRGILALHGGSIRADSEGENRGSTFTVRLPLAPVQATPASIQSAPDAVQPASVLVVDDNVDAAETLLMFLELSGCQARVAHSAGEALGVLEGFTPQVALFDIGLPDMNGYELARRVRLLPGGADMLLVAATGWGQESDKRLAFDAGFDHHLTKPIDFDKLRALLAGA
ncbi:ATP-binding protein [Massilia sp. Leaf139]|uniref:hybrid sensor histidine kinase/response regulator n=1 Tax=Massilia sp. Leaf139 TaxID=1736272 RepID=UPI000A680A01|nr:ATP-binding protein [Massilia sp. Leaf139]